MVAETMLSARVAQQQLKSDLAPIERYNARVEEVNGRVVQVLQAITGQEFDEQGHYDLWRAWWTDQQGYAYHVPLEPEPKPTVTQNVPLAYQPQTRPYTQTSPAVVGYRRAQLLRRGDPRPDPRRPAADRDAPRRRPGAHPGHDDRRPQLPADPGRLPQPAEPDRPRPARRRGPSDADDDETRTTRSRSSPPASTGSGRRARAGSWPAT